MTDEAIRTRLHVISEPVKESKDLLFGEFGVISELCGSIRKDDLMVQSPVEGQLRSVDLDCLPQSEVFVERMEREYFYCGIDKRLSIKRRADTEETPNWC
ncbi:hypothetical protein Hrd1104_03875 [Halorhabdus sp. CBA1104]|nr:hypothetical protein Hrd1104_03875 [Halorhabdus sp. CBA1104]